MVGHDPEDQKEPCSWPAVLSEGGAPKPPCGRKRNYRQNTSQDDALRQRGPPRTAGADAPRVVVCGPEPENLLSWSPCGDSAIPYG